MLSIFAFVGCAGPVNVSIRPDTSFDQNSTITIVSGGADPLNVTGQLEFLFSSKGFNVVSEAVGRDRIEYDEKIKNSPTQQNTTGAIERVKRLQSAYMLRYSYGYRPDFPNGNVFTNFTATIVDLSDGKIVASTNFSQGEFGSKSVSKTLTEFVDQLAHTRKRMTP
jgi:hypothetical protein